MDLDFWNALTGQGDYSEPQTVAKAAQDAAARALSSTFWRARGKQWQDACGIAGFKGLKDALATKLID